MNNNSWRNNTQYFLTTTQDAKVYAFLRYAEKKASDVAIGFYVFEVGQYQSYFSFYSCILFSRRCFQTRCQKLLMKTKLVRSL